MGVEIELRWGSTLLDVIRVDEFSLDGTPLVRAGVPLAERTGAVGSIEYELRDATPVSAVPRPRGDRRLVPYVIAVGVLQVAITMSALALPSTTSTVAAVESRPTRRARITPSPEMPPDQGQARAMRGARGAVGAGANEHRGHVAISNTGELPQLARAEAIDRARHAGILGTHAMSPDAFASLVGPDAVTSGFDARMAEAALAETSGTSAGFGSTRTGLGGGGGGTGNTIGLGRVGDLSDGTSFGHGWGGEASAPVPMTWSSGGPYEYVPLPHRMVARRNGPMLRICEGELRARCQVDGALDQQVVRRHVRRRGAQLAYCFERYLLAHPGPFKEPLELEFDSDAAVLSATATGAPPEVAQCAVDVVRASEFPRGPTHVVLFVEFR